EEATQALGAIRRVRQQVRPAGVILEGAAQRVGELRDVLRGRLADRRWGEAAQGGLADLGRLFLTPGEAIAAAAHRGEELLEVDLERGEDLVGVVLGPQPDLPLGLASVLEDLLGGALGLLIDLLLGDQTGLLI